MQAIGGSFSKYRSSGQLIKSKVNKLISLYDQINTGLEAQNDSLAIIENNIKLDSLYFIIGKIYQLDFTINDSAIFYLEKIISNFPESKFRYQSMTALNDINFDTQYWKNTLINDYPDSTYISDSSYKEIDIIKEIYDELFIDNEMNYLELLNTFTELFIDEQDSLSIIDTNNIQIELDTLNKVLKNDVQ